jgi:pimeloyl-ACP methyl ester carboxylesterase
MHVRGVDLHVEEQGHGAPILFSHGLLWSGRMFAPQVRVLHRHHRCVVYDHRGQGRSEIPRTPIIDIETVYEDAVAIVEALGLAPCHFVGLSMGGFVGLRIAARRPELLRSLTLVDTAADPEPLENLPKYAALSVVARAGALRLTRSAVLRVMFGDTFLRDPTRADERARLEAELMGNRPTVVRAVAGVLTRRGIQDELHRIRTPTLVLHGLEDRAIAMRRAEAMCAGIRGARLVKVPAAGHSSPLENPAAITAAIAEHVGRH